mgnify:FL=1
MTQTKIKAMTLCALFTALAAVVSQIAIPLAPVPVNLATFAVFLAGGLLGGKLGALSQIVYVLLGAFGLPVFAGMTGGFGRIMGPTGGYIAGYVVAAYLTGLLIERLPRGFWSGVFAMICGLAACYALGTLWFLYLTGNDLVSALGVCVVPFLPGDAIKITLASLITHRLKKSVAQLI